MPYRYRVLILLFFLVFVMYLDRLCIAVAGPRIQKELALSPSEWGWVIGVFTLAYAFFEVPSGALGDRIGPRRVLTRIVLWWSAFTAMTGAVTGFAPLLVVRFLFGAGEAGAFPNCAVTVSRWIPLGERARATGVFWLATAVGGAITPLIVVTIQKVYGWRLSFYLFGSLGVVWGAIWYWWFRDTPRGKAGVSAEEIALIGIPPSSHAPVPWRVILKNRNFRLILLMYHTYCWGGYFFLSWLPTYLQTGRNLTEDEMKIASSLPFWAGLVGIVTGSYLSDQLSRRYSLRLARCSIGAASLLIAGILMLGATLTPNKWTAVVLLTVGAGAMDAMLPVSWSVCMDIGRQHAGAISGAMNMSGQVGSFISSVAFGYLVQWFGSYDRALIPLSAMLLLSGILFAMIDPAAELLRVAVPEPAASEC